MLAAVQKPSPAKKLWIAVFWGWYTSRTERWVLSELKKPNVLA
jgi:hypothetical protein